MNARLQAEEQRSRLHERPETRERLPAGGVSRQRQGGSWSSNPRSPTTIALFRVAIVGIAPAVLLAGSLHHPWIGNPGDPGFLERLAAAVATDPTHWAVAHLLVAVGSGLLILAFLAIRSYLREAGEERWSVLGLPFIVMGSVLYALLPAMEFAPLAANGAGADAAAAQAALLPWFAPILLTSAAIFALGVLGFVIGIVRSRLLAPGPTWLIVGALVVMAAARFFPVGAAQLYVGPTAGVVALWVLGYAMWRDMRSAGWPGP